MKPNWKRVSSGRYVNLNNLQLADLDIVDVDVALNNIIRFTGHHRDMPPLTVAQHSLLCLNLARLFEPDDVELHLAVFTHDFAESLIGDVATPVKRAMGDFWKEFADPIELLFEMKYFGEHVDPELHHRVKLYDLAALDIERRVMWASQYGKDKWPASPLNVGTIADKEELFADVFAHPVGVHTIWKELYEQKYSLQTQQTGEPSR